MMDEEEGSLAEDYQEVQQHCHKNLSTPLDKN